MVTHETWRALTPIFDISLSSESLIAQGEVFAIVNSFISSTQLDPPHWHDTYEIGYVLKGTGIMVMGERVYSYVAGQVYVINDLEPHRSYSDDEDTRLFVVHFHPNLLESGWIGQMRREARTPFLPQFGQDGPLLPLHDSLTVPIRTLLEAIREEALLQKPLWDIIVSGLLFQAIGLFARQMMQTIEYTPKELQQRRALKRLQPVLQLLQDRYTEALSLDELASAGSMSSPYCCELFRLALSTTPISYRNSLRLMEARKLIQTTDLTIHDIAYRVGFQSVQEFNRLFRRDTRCSPSQFRGELRI
jgi:AraC-like DNA-binding protein/quercetin dioxygenase-like cupin family protein